MGKLTVGLFVLCAACGLCGAQALPPVEAAYSNFVAHAGDASRLEAVFARGERGEKLVIAAIGGSITEGAFADSREGQWGGQVAEWFRRAFPRAKVEYVNAGIGATGSAYGAHRFAASVAAKDPDVVGIDFAVNDHPGDVPAPGETDEGVVRQALACAKRPFVYQLSMMHPGVATAEAAHLAVSRHYGVTHFSLADALTPFIDAKAMTYMDFTRDNLHPNGAGHRYLGALVARYLDERLAAYRAGVRTDSAVRKPPEGAPLHGTTFGPGRVIPAVDLKLAANRGFEVSHDPKNQRWPKALRGRKPGDTLSFEVDAPTCAILHFVVKGPMGRADVKVDGRPVTTVDGWFDKTWGGMTKYTLLWRDRPGRHTVEITISGEKSEGSEGFDFELDAVLTAGDVPPAKVSVTKPYFRWLFGGFGFQHPEANFEALMTDEFRDQRALKSFAEISPTFGRVYTGFAGQSKEQLDRFADYYHKTFAKAGTVLYAVPYSLKCRPEDKTVSPEEYAEKVAVALEYLVRTRDCRRIRYYCLSNELTASDRWGWFGQGRNMELHKKWMVALYDAFRRHDLDILLVGSDKAVTSNYKDALPAQQWVAANMDDWLGAYVTHWYVYGFPVDDLNLWDVYNRHFNDHVQLALGRHKRYILGEFGFCPVWGGSNVMVDDTGAPYRQPATAAEAVLCKCEVALAAINQGAYGCISWSFVDYPDPFVFEDGHTAFERARHEAGKCVYRPDLKYNKWGMFRWSDVDRDYRASPELYAVGHLGRLFRQGATVLACASDDRLVRTGAVMNPDRTFTVALVNRGGARAAEVDCASWFGGSVAEPRAVARRYVYEAARPPDNAFNDLQAHSGTVALEKGVMRLDLPAKSVTFLTTDYVDRAPKAVEGVSFADGVLAWRAADDADHRYYRVYCDGRQIASTVATALRTDKRGDFAVRSVDRWLNEGK